MSLEERIIKQKLPKGWSYPIKTNEIIKSLDTTTLALSYSYNHDNPDKVKDEHYTLKIVLCNISKHKQTWQFRPSLKGDETPYLYDTYMVVYSVPSIVRKVLESGFIDLLPHIKKWQQANTKGHNITAYYETFHPSKWAPLDNGGLYLVQDRYKDKEALLWRDKTFNIDKLLVEYL